MKINASTIRRTSSERRHANAALRRASRADGSAVGVLQPAVAEAGIVGECIECVIHRAELLPDTLHHRAHVGAIALLTTSGEEALATHRVIDLAIGNI